MWTILHVPAINIPDFASENDLPIRLTLVGARYYDLYVLYTEKAINEVFERGGGGGGCVDDSLVVWLVRSILPSTT